jgi:hypothetical protein
MDVALSVPRDHCLAAERVDAPIGEGGRYGRMFDLEPGWSPTLPARGKTFRLVDLLVP